MVFHEFCYLKHYLEGRTTLADVLEGVKTINAVHTGIGSSKVPAEMKWYLGRGLEKKAENRFKSVDEMVSTLQLVLDGRFKVQCPQTMTKRVLLALSQTMDRRPRIMLPLIFGGVGLFLLSVGKLLFDVIRAL